MDTPSAGLGGASPRGLRACASPTQPGFLERDRVLSRLRDARFSDGLFCPHCRHRQVQRWGTFSGRQRYRCKGCRRTFSDLTGTPAAYLKKIELLPACCTGLAAQLSIRQMALQLGVHPSTAFRWRHRLLDGLRAEDSETVAGWVELGSFWLPESYKGQRHLPPGIGRPQRRRFGRGRWNLFYDGPRVHVVVACDRRGHVVSAMSPHPTRGPLTTWALEAALESRLPYPDRVNFTATRPTRSAAVGFAVRVGAAYHDAFLPSGRLPRWLRGRRRPVRPPPGDRSLVHVRTVDTYIRRFRDWLRAFRGVSSRYLPNYLLWHRLVDADGRNCFAADLLRWPCPAGARR